MKHNIIVLLIMVCGDHVTDINCIQASAVTANDQHIPGPAGVPGGAAKDFERQIARNCTSLQHMVENNTC